MTDSTLEKVIKGLEYCIDYAQRVKDLINDVPCEGCPYVALKSIKAGQGDCIDVLFKDALALLKAQEPRVMTPADVNNIGPEDVCAFVEIREETHMYACYMRQYDETHTEIMCDVPDLPTKLNNGCARLWTSRPTDAQREATPWDAT